MSATSEAQGTEASATVRLTAMARRALRAWRSPSGRDSRMIVLIGLNLVALIVAFTMIVLRQVSDTVVVGGQARAERLAKTAAYQLRNALVTVERSLRYAEREIVRADAPAILSSLADSDLLPTHLVVMMTFNDINGFITATTQGPLEEQRVRVSDREFVRVHLEGTVGGAYVGRPFMGRISSRWAIPVSRAVHGSDGRLMGVLTAEIDVAAMGAIWRDIGLMSDDVIEVVAPNGEAWIRWPSAEDSLAPAKAQLMGSDRYISYEDAVVGWPLRLRAALDRRRIMAEAAPVQLAILAVAGAGCMLVFWFAALLVRKTREVGIERDAAQAAQKRMRAAIDVVPVDFTEFDREGRLVLANQAARQSNPWTVDAEGKTLREILDKTADRFRDVEPGRDWQAWTEEQIGSFERAVTQEVRRPNGDWKRIYYADMPGGGRVVLRVDISEIKRREELLEASERRYAELVGSLPDVIISIDQALRITYASEAAAEVLGIGSARLVGQSLPSMIAPDDRGYVATVLDGLRAVPGRAETIVCEVLRGDGATRFMQLRLKSSAAKVTEQSSLSGVIRDIHEQQVLARKLDKEMTLLSSIFQSTGAHIMMLDRDERVVLANQAVRSVLTMSESELAGLSYRAIPQPGLDARVVERWRAASGNDKLDSVEFEETMTDGAGKTHILRVTANPVQDEQGILRYIVLIGVDDTQRRQAEIRLFDASRLANLGEMASGVAHEINQPLAVIRLAAESVAEELEEGPDVDKIPAELLAFFKQKLERIAAQTERASGIIRDLRTVARQPGNVAHPFDLAEAVRVGCDLLQEQMRLNRVRFELNLPTPGPRVMGEAGRLQQVVINLVNNARDALVERGPAPESGQVGVIAVSVKIDPLTRRVMLLVEDDGPGIPPQVLPRLFEPFFTTKPVGKGTGLGLSISYDIVHRMGGEMSAENRPEGGARFKIGFPPAIGNAQDLRPAA